MIENRRRISDTLAQLATIVLLLAQLAFVAYKFGRLEQAVDDISIRLVRCETIIDRLPAR